MRILAALQKGDTLGYRKNVEYYPRRHMTKNGGKMRYAKTTLADIISAPELNPALLNQQGIESGIDLATQNVVYKLDNGSMRIGFYDRANAERVQQSPTRDRTALTHDLQLLVNAQDPNFARIPIMGLEMGASAFLGESFPRTFNYRSAVFEGNMTYGVFVDADKSLFGAAAEFTDVPLTGEFIAEHETELNYLLPLIIEAAEKKSIPYRALTMSDQVDAGGDLFSLMKLGTKYGAKISYKRTPQILVTARLNGTPIICAYSEQQSKAFESGLIGPELDDSFYGLVSRASYRNLDDETASSTAPLLYEVISRDESIAGMKENEQFGVFEIQVVAGYRVDDFSATFTIEKDDPQPSREPDFGMERGPTRSMSMSMDSGYTAGRSRVGEASRATLETAPFSFERVLLRDAFCLVHKEQARNAKPYT